jgi:polyhydroxyalkanoate synthesis regulator phasin
MIMKKKLTATALGAVFALASFSSAFAAEVPTQSKAPLASSQNHHASLDDSTKQKIKAIWDQVKAGTLTKEEAKAQFEALGIKAPKGDREGRFANLDDATKQKVKAIWEQVKAGTLTKEEAKAQLEALGIKLPDKGHKHVTKETK